MIKSSRQLKDLVRNIAKGDSGKSQLLIRNYAMERFLERIVLSKYKDNFVLKGGMLVSAMAGLDNRSTMDLCLRKKLKRYWYGQHLIRA